MANPYFAPFQNSLATLRDAAQTEYNVRQQQQQNALQQGMMGLRQQQMGLQQQQMQQDLAAQRQKIRGNIPVLAQRIISLPQGQRQEAYDVAAREGLLGDQPPAFDQLGAYAGLAEQPEGVDPYAGYDSGYETFARANRLPPDSPETYQAYQDDIIAQKRAGATNVTTNVGGQTKGRTKADEAFAGAYVDYVASGGFADTMKQISQLRGVVKNLRSRDDLTGPIIGSVPDSIKKFTNPDAIATREAVEEVVQRNLKAVLGGQFTEREGEKLVSRAYNPALSEEENAKRVTRLLNQIEQAAKAKKSAADYFEKNGTITGWKGKLPKLDDFYEATAPKTADEYLKKFGGQ